MSSPLRNAIVLMSFSAYVMELSFYVRPNENLLEKLRVATISPVRYRRFVWKLDRGGTPVTSSINPTSALAYDTGINFAININEMQQRHNTQLGYMLKSEGGGKN